MAPQRKEPASGKWKEEMGAGGVKEINEKEIRRKSRKMGAEKGFPCTCNFIERGPKSRPPSGTHLGHENDSPGRKTNLQRLVFCGAAVTTSVLCSGWHEHSPSGEKQCANTATCLRWHRAMMFVSWIWHLMPGAPLHSQFNSTELLPRAPHRWGFRPE